MKKLVISNTYHQSGQVVIILLLTMLAGLGIGLAVTQRSLTDVNTSTQTEQSSRAFSAAEAGIEQALQSDILGSPPPSGTTDLKNESNTSVTPTYSLPRPNQALEYPEVTADNPAQIWLADPAQTPPTAVYNHPQIDLYYGRTDGTTPPLVEVITVIRQTNGAYRTTRTYIKPSSTAPSGVQGFTTISDLEGGTCSSVGAINTTFSTTYDLSGSTDNDRLFKCKVTLNISPASGEVSTVIRVKLLGTDTSHPVALNPRCPTGTISCKLPTQANLYTSIGKSGQTQKKLQLLRVQKYLPSILDFALFSNSSITKY